MEERGQETTRLGKDQRSRVGRARQATKEGTNEEERKRGEAWVGSEIGTDGALGFPSQDRPCRR